VSGRTNPARLPRRRHRQRVRRGTGEGVVVLGANGAGTTTLFRVIAELLAPQSGHIRLGGEAVAGRAAEAVVRSGISRVPTGRGVISAADGWR
jgi:branched-chain amino acid transport system ATP-binding protein